MYSAGTVSSNLVIKGKINVLTQLESDNSDSSRCQLLFGKKLLFPDHFSTIAITALSDIYSHLSRLFLT